MNDEIDNIPINLNHLPADFSTRDNVKKAQFDTGSSSSGQSSRRRKKKDDDNGKVYECRFCALKFCKSQALGGHMNRHRPERETETLNKARMLVFSNENSISTVHGLPAHHLGGFHQPLVDQTLHFRPAYPVQVQQPVSMRLPASTQSATALHIHLNQPQPYLYPSPPLPLLSYPSRYHPSNDYSVGKVFEINGAEATNYTCIGAPVGHSSLGSTNSVRENGTLSMHTSVSSNGHHGSIIKDDGLSWGMRGFRGTSHQQLQQPARLDLSLAINRFQDRL